MKHIIKQFTIYDENTSFPNYNILPLILNYYEIVIAKQNYDLTNKKKKIFFCFNLRVMRKVVSK